MAQLQQNSMTLRILPIDGDEGVAEVTVTFVMAMIAVAITKKPLNYISFDSIIHVFILCLAIDVFILCLIMFICIYSVFGHFYLYLFIH